MIVISACLVGCDCRYDGGSKLVEELQAMVQRGEAVFVCPEQLGGLSTPRPPARIRSGTGADVIAGQATVRTNADVDVTEQFVKGAHEALKMAQLVNAKEAILKERSPSCGSSKIYGDHGLIEGHGVTAALLEQHGIKVYSEETHPLFAGSKGE